MDIRMLLGVDTPIHKKGGFMPDSNKEAKNAKADAQAAKAKAKALRPWYQKKRFIVPIALVLLIGISQAMNGGSGTDNSANDTTSDEGSTSEEATNEMLGIGDAAVDGDFSFTVSGVECGIPSVGTDVFGVEAQGQFCLVSVSIENIGSEAKTMFADSQKLFDSEGREFSADTSAMIYLEDGADSWLSEINPGNTLAGQLLFDVPADAAIDYIVLYEGVFSSGVEVSLK
jgi:hypothetical protein